MLDAPMEFNGLLLNDQSERGLATGKYFKVISIAGLDDADVRDVRQERPGFHGEISSDSFYGGRSITITGELRAKNLTDLRAMEFEIKRAFGDLLYHNLVYKPWGQAQRFLRARKVQKLDIPDEQATNQYRRPFTVTVRAEDPFAYGMVEKISDFTEIGIRPNLRTYSIAPKTWSQKVQSSVPRAWYRLDDVSGTVANDSSGNNLHGTISGGPTLGVAGAITGETGTCFDFGGSIAQKVAIPPPVQMMPQAFTVSAWIYRDVDMATYEMIWDADSATRTMFLAILNGSLIFGIHTGSISLEIQDAATPFPIGQWIHVAVTIQGNIVRMYKNGVNYHAQGITGYNPTSISGTSAWIGVSNGNALPFNGKIDELIFHDKALEGFEIQDLYTTPYPVAYQKRPYPRAYITDTSTPAPAATNAGNQKAYPVSRIHGYIENPILTNLTTGQRIIFKDLVIQENSFIDINHKTGVIKWQGVNENYSGLDIVNSEFFTLVPGSNQLQLSALNYASSAHWLVIWRDTYL